MLYLLPQRSGLLQHVVRAPNAYLVVGTDGRVLRANRRLADLLGFPMEELVGAVIHSFAPDTPAGKPRSMELYRKHLAGESVSGWELELRRKDGRPSDCAGTPSLWSGDSPKVSLWPWPCGSNVSTT